MWHQYTEFNNSALVPTAYGFSFKSSEVINEITACLNISDQYVKALYAGSLDPDTTIEKLNEEMKKAGIEFIIDEKQKQLDEWLTNKN